MMLKFLNIKSSVLINDRNMNKIAASNKLPLSQQNSKYFIGQKDAKKVRPLWIFLPKKVVYVIDFDQNKCVSFMTED